MVTLFGGKTCYTQHTDRHRRLLFVPWGKHTERNLPPEVTFSAQLSPKYIHNVVQSMSRTFSSCKTETLSPFNTTPPPLPQPSAPTTPLSVSMTVTALKPSHPWDHTGSVFLRLADLTQYDVLQAHPRWSLGQAFLPFQG